MSILTVNLCCVIIFVFLDLFCLTLMYLAVGQWSLSFHKRTRRHSFPFQFVLWQLIHLVSWRFGFSIFCNDGLYTLHTVSEYLINGSSNMPFCFLSLQVTNILPQKGGNPPKFSQRTQLITENYQVAWLVLLSALNLYDSFAFIVAFFYQLAFYLASCIICY